MVSLELIRYKESHALFPPICLSPSFSSSREQLHDAINTGVLIPFSTDSSPTPKFDSSTQKCQSRQHSLVAKKEEIGKRLTGMDIDGCFNHPVVILSEPAQGKATVLIVTSLDGQDLSAKYPRNKYQRDRHLPISPNDAHPDHNIIFFLKDDAELRKKSYVKIESQYTVPIASLTIYCRSGRPFKLERASYDILRAYVESTPAVTSSSPQNDLFISSRCPSTSRPEVLVAQQVHSRTTQRTVPQVYLTPHMPATSRSVNRGHSRAAVTPASYRSRVIPDTWQDPHTHNDPKRNGQVSLLPCNRPPNRPSPPEPNYSARSAFIVPLLFLGFVCVVIYSLCHLFNLAKWTLKGMKEKWTGARFTMARINGSQLVNLRKGLVTTSGCPPNKYISLSYGLSLHPVVFGGENSQPGYRVVNLLVGRQDTPAISARL
ncbi:MAG: hypothetical protein Q9167_001090 [Letrouitia subvulpina]